MPRKIAQRATRGKQESRVRERPRPEPAEFIADLRDEVREVGNRAETEIDEAPWEVRRENSKVRENQRS